MSGVKYFAKRYGKVSIAVAAAGLVALQAAVSDNQVTPDEWVHIVTVCLAALGVYFAPYMPKLPPPSA